MPNPDPLPIYQYIRISFDFGDLHQMNALGSAGWRAIAVERDNRHSYWGLMERQVPETDRPRVQEYYASTDPEITDA